MIDELIARLEKATGEDRGLDGDIAVACGDATGFLERHGKRVDGYVSKGEHHAIVEAPRYTASIDAALTLVPEISDIELYFSAPLIGQAAVVLISADGEPTTTRAVTPAIALCIAALKARAATPQGEKPKKVHDAHTSPEGGQKRSSVSTDDAAESAMAGRAHKQ